MIIYLIKYLYISLLKPTTVPNIFEQRTFYCMQSAYNCYGLLAIISRFLMQYYIFFYSGIDLNQT